MIHEDPSECFCATETDESSGVRHSTPGVQSRSRSIDPDHFDVPSRRGAKFYIEQPRQLPRTQRGVRRKTFHAMVAAGIGCDCIGHRAQS
jgi:hypothetical protein